MAKDPYKYYRIEARELLDAMSQGVIELDKGGAGNEVCARLLRVAHTLKGAARVVKQPATAELAHSFEEILAPHREAAPPREKVGELLRVVDAIDVQIKALDQAAPAAAPAPVTARAPVPDEPFTTVRVEVAEMDALLEDVCEAAVQITGLFRETAALDDALRLAEQLAEQDARSPARTQALAVELREQLARLGHGLRGGLGRAQTEIKEVRERANRLRLVPAGTVFPTLERAVHDAAAELGKRVEFSSSGGDHRLDGHVLAPLRAALLHAVRNAVAHGIESDVERAAAGKPHVGKIAISVARRGGRLAFRCTDDGRGFDVAALRQAAQRAGKLGAGETLDAAGAVKLALAGGVSTTGVVNEISGRGIGLDVVRATVAGLKGELNVSTEPGRGATLELLVPVSLSSMPVLLVLAGGQVVCVPLDAVRRTARLAAGDLARSGDGRIFFDGEHAVPYVQLGPLVGGAAAAAPDRDFVSALLIESPAGWAALGVDRMLGTAEVLVRPLPAAMGAVALILGASFDADGDPRPVLDPDGLVNAARGARLAPAAAPARRPRLLVVDDSLTTRMLEQSILEVAGYDVDLAVSGEEGLAMAHDGGYALYIVDVEMPGMNGFQVLERFRADAQLRATPAILMTSLADAENQRRGLAAGARAYIVKGEFDQARFLDTIRGLVTS